MSSRRLNSQTIAIFVRSHVILMWNVCGWWVYWSPTKEDDNWPRDRAEKGQMRWDGREISKSSVKQMFLGCEIKLDCYRRVILMGESFFYQFLVNQKVFLNFLRGIWSCGWPNNFDDFFLKNWFKISKKN